MSSPVIAVLIPTRGTLFTQTVSALDRELAKYPHVRFYTTDLPIPDCRNALVQKAIDSGIAFTHYLMVDDDVIMPQGGLDAMLEVDEDIVVIDYPTHWMGGEAKHTGNVAYTDDSRKEISWAGLGCTLVTKKVIDSLDKPYFVSGGQYFDTIRGGKKVLYGKRLSHGGEDVEFFFALKEKGFDIHKVDGMIAGHAKILRHIGVVEQGKYAKQHDIHVADKIDRPFK